MAIFGRNTGKTPSLSHMLRMGVDQDKGWKVRLFIKWIKEFGGEYAPFNPEKDKPKHHDPKVQMELHDLTRDHRYTDVNGNHIVRHATHTPITYSREYSTRIEPKRDKSMSGRQWKIFKKAERREAKVV